MIKNTELTTRPAGPIHPTVAAKMFRTRLRNRIPLKMPKRWMHRELKAGGVFDLGWVQVQVPTWGLILALFPGYSSSHASAISTEGSLTIVITK